MLISGYSVSCRLLRMFNLDKLKMMKKTISVIAFVALTAFSVTAQKLGFVDTDYILASIPEYKAAQAEMDKLSVDWQKEVEAKYSEVDKLYKAYQADAILLTDDMKKKRENEIINKEKEVKELQKQRFGVDGELFKKRQELVKPIQDKVYNAVKAVAERGGIAIMLDKAGQVAILYANTKYDKSEEVISYLGYNKK